MIALAEADLPEKNELGQFDNDENSTDFEFDAYDLNVQVVQLDAEEDVSEKIISYIEKLIRKSLEYKRYIGYLRQELNLNTCSLLPGLDARDAKISLEFHHYPLNLFEITQAVVNKKISELDDDQTISCFEIADIVMQEHYKNKIGLVPLSASLHKMAHNKAILIPFDKIYGNYENFLSEYDQHIPEEIKERIAVDKITNASDEAARFNKEKLEKKVSKFNINYDEE